MKKLIILFLMFLFNLQAQAELIAKVPFRFPLGGRNENFCELSLAVSPGDDVQVATEAFFAQRAQLVTTVTRVVSAHLQLRFGSDFKLHYLGDDRAAVDDSNLQWRTNSFTFGLALPSSGELRTIVVFFVDGVMFIDLQDENTPQIG